MRRPHPRCAVLVLLALAAQSSCSCNEQTPANSCPEYFDEGERCAEEGMVCVWPGGRCASTPCTCESQPGAFRWKCTPSLCRCTCPCGYTAASTCEAVECSNPADPCPASAAAICALICTDSGVTDAGLPDGPTDAKVEGPPDLRGEGPADQGSEAVGDAQGDRSRDQQPDLPDARPVE